MSLSISKVCAIILFFVASVHANAPIWQQKDVSELKRDAAPSINIFSNTTNVCIFDEITLHWSYVDGFVPPLTMFVLVATSNSSSGLMTQLNQAAFLPNKAHSRGHGLANSQSHGLITCLINEEHCSPSVITIMANAENSSDPHIVLTFDQNTSTPELHSAREIAEALHLHPPIRDEAMGSWVSPKELVLHVSSAFFNAIMDAHRNSGQVVMSVRTQRIESQGNFTLRPSEAGQLLISIIDDGDKTLSQTVEVQVDLCAGSVLLPTASRRMLSPEREKTAPKPSIRVTGVVPMSSRRTLAIPHSSVDSTVCLYRYIVYCLFSEIR